ncbi:hypothetical protein TNCV_1615081 [Trichonephila clavipes]|nr:hypothetical protein TNCV_1615081 [Trichonephila clavipes]
MEQSTFLNVGLWSGREEKKRKIGMTRKRAENRERSLGFPGFVKPVFTKDSKPLGKRKRSLGHLGSVKTRTHLKKVSPLGGDLCGTTETGQSRQDFARRKDFVCRAEFVSIIRSPECNRFTDFGSPPIPMRAL